MIDLDLGLLGWWNTDYGDLYSIKIWNHEESGENEDTEARYACCGTSKGVMIIDIDKRYVTSFISLDQCYDLEIKRMDKTDDLYAYIAGGNSGLYIFNINNPKNPSYKAQCDTPGFAARLAIKGDYAYVADAKKGLQVIDINNKALPKIIGNFPASDSIEGVAIEGGYAYVADGRNGLQVIDIGNPKFPKFIGNCSIPGFTYNLDIKGGYACVAGGNGLQVINIRDPNEPEVVGSCDTSGLAQGLTVDVNEDYAYVADGGSGLQVINIRDPNRPEIVGSFDTDGYAQDVAIESDYAYVADAGSGLQIIDISDKGQPELIGSCFNRGFASDVTIDGGYAYVPAGENGIQIFHINNQKGLMYIGSCDTPGEALSVFIDNNYAFLADSECGLQIIDIKEKSRPELVGCYDTPGYARDVVIADNYAYVADSRSVLQIINISDKRDPNNVGTFTTLGNAYGVSLKGDLDNYIYIAEDRHLQIIDISGKNIPEVVGTFNTSGTILNVSIRDGYAYAVNTWNDLQIIDISTPSNPDIVRAFAIPSETYDVALWGDYAFVAAKLNGLQVIDISDPNSPSITGSCDTLGWAGGVALSGDGEYVLVADGENGLLQFEISDHPSPRGNLILVTGRDIDYRSPYWHVTEALANQVFRSFINKGYRVYDIYYFNPDFIQDIDQDGIPDQLAVDDFDPDVIELKNIIGQFPDDHMTTNTGPLYIYLIGHGAEDRFHLRSYEVVSAGELKKSIHDFQKENPNREVALIIESAASGSFIDDLADPNDPYQNTFIITSTGHGPSFIKPSSDPNAPVPVSFTGLLMDKMQNYSLEDLNLLKEAFIDARTELYLTQGLPFLGQAPQMYIPEGPISLHLISDSTNLSDPNILNNLPDTLIIDQNNIDQNSIALIPIAIYKEGNIEILDPRELICLSSNNHVLDPNNEGHFSIEGDRIILTPGRNGITSLIAYPDPKQRADILLTACLRLEISISGKLAGGGNKAIIVAGTENNEEGKHDKLTNIIAKHAYLTLRRKGLSREDIIYLNPHFDPDFNPSEDLDIDRNGKNDDDIDGSPNLNGINKAIEQICQTHADELLIFFVAHGEKDKVSITPDEELSDDNLKEFICTVAPSVEGHIIVLIDACNSGSFINSLPQKIEGCGIDPNKIIIITSTSSKEEQKAYSGMSGLLAFSYGFFDEFLLTNSLMSSFEYGSFFIPPDPNQTPDLYDQDNIKERDKGLCYYIDDPRPVIDKSDYKRIDGNIEISAQVFSLEEIEEVCAYIMNYGEAHSFTGAGIPYSHMIPLAPETDNPHGGLYTAKKEDPFPDTDTYQIILTVKDKNGKVSIDRTNLYNQESYRTGAVILVTDLDLDEIVSMRLKTETGLKYAGKTLPEVINDQSYRAYHILRDTRLTDDDIYYVKTRRYLSYNWGYSSYEYVEEDPNYEYIDEDPGTFSIEHLAEWLQGKEYKRLLIYLIGKSLIDDQGEEPYFILDDKTFLLPSDITDSINLKDCRLILFYEMEHARDFLRRSDLSSKQDWIGIACPYIDLTRPLFSNYFFSRIYCFDTFGEAFERAYKAFDETSNPHYRPLELFYCPYFYSVAIEDNQIAEEIKNRFNFCFGPPAFFSNENSLIKDTEIIHNETGITLLLRVNQFADVDPNSPRAELRALSGEYEPVNLYQEDPTTWSSGPMEKNPIYYKALFYVEQIQDKDHPGIIDWRVQNIGNRIDPNADQFEEDDGLENAKRIALGIPQEHNFHDPNDRDCVYFFGHKNEKYLIGAYDLVEKHDYSIMISLYDSEGKLVKQTYFYNPFYNEKAWYCQKDGYYTLMVEEDKYYPSNAPYSYTLSIEISPDQSPTPSADIQGRVVDQNHEGINGVYVYAQTDKSTWKRTSTGSIKNVKRPNTYQTMNPRIKTEGWYFMDNLPAPGSYRIKVTAKDDPNTILAEPSIYLYENNIHWIDDIVIVQDLLPSQKDPNKEAVDGLERAYNRWQLILGRQYIPWEDTDNDEFSNLEEFLNGTNPSDPNHPSLQYNLYPGLNLFPFHLKDLYWAADFCFERLEEDYHSMCGYNEKENLWDYWYKDSGGTDFLLEKGKGYLIYKHTPEKIHQEEHNSTSFLTQGINLIGISPIPEVKTLMSYTSFNFLRDRKNEGIKSISRYRDDLGKENKSKDIWETSYLFFGRPAGVEFPILPNEAYLVEVNRE